MGGSDAAVCTQSTDHVGGAASPEQWTCALCGAVHEKLPLCYSADAPWKMMLSEAEFGERVRLTEDTCVVDGEAFFIRGHIEIPLHDMDGNLVYSAWCSLSRAS